MHTNRFSASLLKATLLLLTMNLLLPQAVFAARCLYISSYHAGYVWNDDIEEAMEKVLQGQCEIKKFYMDGKRNLTPEFAQQKGREAKKLIETWRPDVVIAADDNVSRYLVMPYLKNTGVSVVFCGINWTVAPYGYPYPNTTGMVEIGPVETLAKEVRRAVPNARQGVFLSADEMTQDKEFALNQKVYAKHGITVTHRPVKTMAAPASLQASMLSKSRSEPPGWITADTPSRRPTSRDEALPPCQRGLKTTRSRASLIPARASWMPLLT